MPSKTHKLWVNSREGISLKFELMARIFGCLTHYGLWCIWQHRTGSTLAQAMPCCLTAPSHYLNQCWLVISKVTWYSSEGMTVTYEDTNQHKIENLIFKISPSSPRDQWVKSCLEWTMGPGIDEHGSPSIIQWLTWNFYILYHAAVT